MNIFNKLRSAFKVVRTDANHKEETYYRSPDLEPYNLVNDNYYPFLSTFRRQNPEPTILTLFNDEMGMPHFAVNYIDSGKYAVGEIFYVSNDECAISNKSSDELHFDWDCFDTNGSSNHAKVSLYRNSEKHGNVFMCRIAGLGLVDDGYTGVQLTKEGIAIAPMKYRIYSVNVKWDIDSEEETES